MTSVPRKIHMPRLEESFCCSSVAKWCSNAGLSRCSMAVAWLSDNVSLLRLMCVEFVVVIRFPSHDRFLIEIEGSRRRLRLPLEPGGVPRIVGRGLAVPHRPEEVDHRQKIADTEHGRSGRREHVENLELGRICVHASRHAEIAENELREERQVESEEDDQSGQPRPTFGI